MKNSDIDLRPLKVGDKAYFKAEFGSKFDIMECIINKVEQFVDANGITQFRYKLKYTIGGLKWYRTQHTYDLDPVKIDWSPYHIFSTQQKAMEYLIAKYKKEIASDIESFKKNAEMIGYNSDAKQLLIEQ